MTSVRVLSQEYFIYLICNLLYIYTFINHIKSLIKHDICLEINLFGRYVGNILFNEVSIRLELNQE